MTGVTIAQIGDNVTIVQGVEAAGPPGVGGGVTDHGALTGLADDDHTQYHNDARGDARYQPLDSDLTAIAALSTTSFGRALLELADAAAGRTALGLGSLATASTITTSEITDGTIVNADISASAAIALSKLATTGTPSSSNFLRGDGAWSTATDSGALQKTSNLSDVSSAKTSRSNLSIPTPGRAAYSSATYYSIPGYVISAISGLTLAANYMYHQPIFVFGDSIVIDRLAFEQTAAAAAGKSFRIGLYAGTTDWQPTGSPLEDSGAIAADGANGVKTYTPSGGTRTLTPGIYILVICSDGGPTLRAWQGSHIGSPIGTSMGSTIPGQLFRAFTFGALPTASEWNGTNNNSTFQGFAAVRISNPSA